jgi:hypothetical protein
MLLACRRARLGGESLTMLLTIPLFGEYVRHADLPLGANLPGREWWHTHTDRAGVGPETLPAGVAVADVLWLVRWR